MPFIHPEHRRLRSPVQSARNRMVMVTQAVPRNEHLIDIHPSIPAELSFKLMLFNVSLYPVQHTRPSINDPALGVLPVGPSRPPTPCAAAWWCTQMPTCCIMSRRSSAVSSSGTQPGSVHRSPTAHGRHIDHEFLELLLAPGFPTHSSSTTRGRAARCSGSPGRC